MNIAKNVYGLDKHAASSLLSDIAAIAGNGMQTIGDLASTTGVFLMGMALLTGGAAGYTAAKLSAHGKQDV